MSEKLLGVFVWWPMRNSQGSYTLHGGTQAPSVERAHLPNPPPMTGKMTSQGWTGRRGIYSHLLMLWSGAVSTTATAHVWRPSACSVAGPNPGGLPVEDACPEQMSHVLHGSHIDMKLLKSFSFLSGVTRELEIT